MFKIPYYYPPLQLGKQIYNPGEGGPSSHMGLLAIAPRTYPTVYAVGLYGFGVMPRQVIGPTQPGVVNNDLSNPLTRHNLYIDGLSKPATG